MLPEDNTDADERDETDDLDNEEVGRVVPDADAAATEDALAAELAAMPAGFEDAPDVAGPDTGNGVLAAEADVAATVLMAPAGGLVLPPYTQAESNGMDGP